MLREAIEETNDLLQELERVRALVPYLIATGVLDQRAENGFVPLAEHIALHQFGGEEAYLALSDLPDQRDGAEPTSHGLTLLNAGVIGGYLLGLAVGQAVGAHLLCGEGSAR